MNTDQIVALLIAERDRLNAAIEALQGPTKRLGRPPKNAAVVSSQTTAPITTGKRRSWSAASKKAQTQRMKAYWKKRKAEEAGK